ncbi:hypothetical protein C8R44DRAFT_916856 [Mycena epipterygia]|nr:hypothetical protein C8R44DRAFT_916856 [Mycena epipterygia]
MSDLADYGGSLSSSSPFQRRPKACTNCRRRKIKCDGAQPCNQCRLRPPRSREECKYRPQPDGLDAHETSATQTIHTLRARIRELEDAAGSDHSSIYLGHPYEARGPGAHTLATSGMGFLNLAVDLGGFLDGPTPINMLVQGTSRPYYRQPVRPFRSDLEICCQSFSSVNIFLERFEGTGYFFMDPHQFRRAALLPLPFGNLERPSPALLSATYLWGTVLSHPPPDATYTTHAFLDCVLQNISQDIPRIEGNAHRLLETIQAEVLLSFYYLHMACQVQGRYHASVAASLAFGADLHLIRSPQHTPYPPFFFQETVLTLPESAAEEETRINAFWAVLIMNNHWGGATITKFLKGDDAHGTSAMALFAKASILLERIIAFSSRAFGPPDPAALEALARRLHTFHTSLPPLPGTQTLVLTYAAVNLAIVRLYAPYAPTTNLARTKCFGAADRIVELADLSTVAGSHQPDPMLGIVYATVASVYLDEITALGRHPARGGPSVDAQARELEGRLGSLMSAVASLAAYSPVIVIPFQWDWSVRGYAMVLIDSSTESTGYDIPVIPPPSAVLPNAPA